jgi:hypothetical protein
MISQCSISQFVLVHGHHFPISFLTNLGNFPALLDRWTWDRAVRTKYAAVSRFRFEPSATAVAVIKELASVGRHRLGRLVPVDRTRDHGNKLHSDGCPFNITPRTPDHPADRSASDRRSQPWLPAARLLPRVRSGQAVRKPNSFPRRHSGTHTQNLRGTGDNKRSEFAMTASKDSSTN